MLSVLVVEVAVAVEAAEVLVVEMIFVQLMTQCVRRWLAANFNNLQLPPNTSSITTSTY